MIIQNNIPGINAARNKGITEGKLKKSLEKLSSGYRINRAGDDAAGLTISELMRSQISGLNQAMRNTQDGIGLTQTGDGALTEVHSMLERMKTLAIQSANGTYTTQARLNLEAEKEQLLDEINRIGGTTNFDEIPLFGSDDEYLEDQIAKGAPIPIITTESDSGLGDIVLQVGHSQPETLDVPRYYISSMGLDLHEISLESVNSSNAAVKKIDDAIEAVADVRADFGAVQNHLEHTHTNLSVTAENMTTAESRIRDTDMADEITKFTKNNILYQAGSSMVAQANSVPQTILSLLQ
ncbi:MAG: flagellin [Hungatella sp.]|jgi:flagellin|nr:flagellin [Hungatella sp.]